MQVAECRLGLVVKGGDGHTSTHGCRVREHFMACLDLTFVLRPFHPVHPLSLSRFAYKASLSRCAKGWCASNARTVLIGKTAWNKCPHPLTTTINVASYWPCCAWRRRVITGRRPPLSSEWIILIDHNTFSSSDAPYKMMHYIAVPF